MTVNTDNTVVHSTCMLYNVVAISADFVLGVLLKCQFHLVSLTLS